MLGLPSSLALSLQPRLVKWSQEFPLIPALRLESASPVKRQKPGPEGHMNLPPLTGLKPSAPSENGRLMAGFSAVIAPDGAVFPVGRGVFTLGLVGHNLVIGDGVCAGTWNLPELETAKSWDGFENMFLLVVDVKQVELSGELRCGLLPGFEQAAHDGGAKRVEKEDNDRAGRKDEVDPIGFNDANDAALAASGAPEPGVGAGN